MKRQRGRNRGGGGGGKPQQQNTNRAFDSNGPEGIKVRGNAQHVFEKYQQLARDANSGGDRVLAENYLQHAEHYFRLLRAMQPTRPAAEILGRDQFSSGFDIDFEDEVAQAQAEAADAAAQNGGGGAQPAEGGEAPPEGGWQAREGGERQERPRDDRGPREDRPRYDDRPRDRFEGRDRDRDGGGGRRDRWRDDRPRDDRPRDERPRDDRPRDDRPRFDRDERTPRDERPRDDRPRDERPRYDRDDRQRDDRPRFDRDRDRDRGDRDRPRYDRDEPRDPLAVVEPQAQPLVSAPEERPSPVLRDAEGGESHAPAFLQTATPRAESAGGEDARPRRRRAPRGGAAPETGEG